MSLADDVARRVLPENVGNREPDREHSCQFADQKHLRALLEQADFDIQTFEKVTDGLWVRRTPADVLAWCGRLREGRILEVLDASARQRLLTALEGELERRTRADGVGLPRRHGVDSRRPRLSGHEE